MAEPETARASRRTVVAGTALACVGVACSGLVAGCATYNANNGGVGGAPAAGGATSAGADSTGSAGAGPAALATTSEVPVGGGKILSGQKIVITQPTAGSFKAFTAVCTHQGCIVDAVANGTIDCPCHGSKFSIKDGSVVHGPAPSPLASVGITVKGTSIVKA